MEEKTKSGKRKLSKRAKLILTLSVVVISVLLIVFTAAQNLGNMTITQMAESVKSYFMSLGAGDGFPYSMDALEMRDIRINNSNLHILTTGKTITLNQTAKEIMPQEHPYSNPAMKSKGTGFIVFDLDSDRFRVMNNTEIIHEDEASGKITAGAIGASGNYAIGSYGENVQSMLTVYNRKNEEIFIWKFKSERITDISLCDNGKFAAVTTVDVKDGEVNSKLYVFDFKSSDYVSCFDYPSTTLVKVDYIKGKNIVAVGNNIRSYIKNNTNRKDELKFGSDMLRNYCITDKGRNALVVSRYGSAALSKLSVYSASNKEQFTITFDKEAKWVDCDERYTAVLFESEVKTFNKSGKQIGSISFEGEPLRVAVDGSRTYVITTSGIQCFDTKGD